MISSLKVLITNIKGSSRYYSFISWGLWGAEPPEVVCKYMHFGGRRDTAFIRFSKGSVTPQGKKKKNLF